MHSSSSSSYPPINKQRTRGTIRYTWFKQGSVHVSLTSLAGLCLLAFLAWRNGEKEPGHVVCWLVCFIFVVCSCLVDVPVLASPSEETGHVGAPSKAAMLKFITAVSKCWIIMPGEVVPVAGAAEVPDAGTVFIMSLAPCITLRKTCPPRMPCVEHLCLAFLRCLGGAFCACQRRGPLAGPRPVGQLIYDMYQSTHDDILRGRSTFRVLPNC